MGLTIKFGIAVIALGGASLTDAAGTPQTRSFVIGPNYMPAVDVDEQSCPVRSKSALEVFRDTLPPEERAIYADPAKGRELGVLMFKQLGFKRSPDSTRATPDNLDELRRLSAIPRGKGGLVSYPTPHLAYNLCTNPDDFPALATGHQEYLGRVAYGMDLDGKVSDDDFTGVDGEAGVDNAWYHAMGCSNIARSLGDPKVGDKVIVSRQVPTLIEVTGIDNDRNDDAVMVNVYASAQALDLNASGGPLAWASFSPEPDPVHTAHVKGRIVDGVLTTDAFDVNLRMHESIINSSRQLRGARLRATLGPDGAIEGGFYGYQTLASLEDAYAQASTIGSNTFSCPAEIKSLRKYADGFPDPKTRRNTAISLVLRFKAVPAFVVHKQNTKEKVATK